MNRMFNFRIVIILAFLLLLAACTADQTEPIVATRPATQPTATAVPDTPTPFPSPTPVLTPPATELPAFPTPPILNDGLEPVVQQLQRFLVEPNYGYIQAAMSDPIAVGGWRSEWRSYTPEQVISEFQSGALPPPLAVTFTNLNMDDVAALLDGQPPATMFGPDVQVVAALHSTGWGQAASDEAILFITEQDGRYAWSGFLYTNGRFADAMSVIEPPVGLIYNFESEGIYQVQTDGFPLQLLDAQTANTPNLLVAPDGRTAAYINEQQQLWLINTATGDQQQFAADFTPSGYLQWGDKNTLFVGIWLDPSEAEGPNLGHIATLDIHSGILQILDEQHLSGGRPTYLSDYTWAAFDVFPAGQDDILTGRTYHPDSGLQLFDQTTFTGNSGNGIFNPAWSPEPNKIAWMSYVGERRVVQVFDMEAKTAVTIFDWDPARFGALVPSPVWSPDGQWLALEVWANGPEGSGLWLLAADGSRQTHLAPDGREPYWINNSQLVYGINNRVHLYDVTHGETARLALPEGSRVLGITDQNDLLTESIPFTDTSDPYVYAVQDVTIYSGPSEDYEVVGSIVAGQTTEVTGAGLNNSWWRVICPDATVGDCWVTDDTAFVVPVDSATPLATPPDPADLAMEMSVSISPDGRWQASASQSEPVLILQSEQFYNALIVTDGTTTWTPVAEWRGYGLGYLSVAVFHWSQDGRYLYYTNIGSPDGCFLYSNGTDLHRLDLLDGSVVEILPPGKTVNLSLLPDESILAYITYNGQEELFVWRDLATGIEQSMAITEPGQYAQTGKIFWTADGTTAVLTLVYNYCLPNQSSSIVRVNIESMTATPLIEKDARLFQIQEWNITSVPQLRLTSLDGQTWLLDINSGELTAE